MSSDKHRGPAKDVEARERATDLEISFRSETVCTGMFQHGLLTFSDK